MGKRIGFGDFSVRATDRSRDDAMYCAHPRLSLWLPRPKFLSGLVLLVIFAVPLVAQTNAATPDVGNTLFEIPSRQYLFGDWGGKRTALEEKGIKFNFLYITDLQANPSGGLQQTQAGWERF